MRKLIILTVATVLGTGVFHLAAQGPSEPWKAKHRVGERYEGVGFDRNVTTVGLELISLLAGSDPDTRAAIDVSRDDEIVVDFLAPKASRYLLTARELDLSEYYWMEPRTRPAAVQGQNTFKGIWKTDVLRELKTKGSRISIGGLGVLVWFDKGDDDVAHVAPAVMRAASAKPPEAIAGYRATFLPDVLFDRVSFSVRAGCQVSDSSKVFPGGGSIGKQYPATSFYVDFSVPAGYSGPVMLEISTTRFVAAKTSTDKSWYCFTHSPSVR
jgi:hypothetical protein